MKNRLLLHLLLSASMICMAVMAGRASMLAERELIDSIKANTPALSPPRLTRKPNIEYFPDGELSRLIDPCRVVQGGRVPYQDSGIMLWVELDDGTMAAQITDRDDIATIERTMDWIRQAVADREHGWQ